MNKDAVELQDIKEPVVIKSVVVEDVIKKGALSMSFGFASIGHFFASVAQDVVKFSKAAAPVIAKIESSEQTVELLSGLVFPEAVLFERGAYALLGQAAQAVQDTGSVAGANGLSLILDKQMVADIAALIPAIEAYAKQFGVAKPGTTTPVIVVPTSTATVIK